MDTEKELEIEVVSEDSTLEEVVEEELQEETVESEVSEEEPTPEEKEIVEEKTFTQEDVDAVVEKRLARERRKVEREQAKAAMSQETSLQIDSQLDPESFVTTEEYVEALAEERAEAIIAHKEQSQSVNAVEEKYQNQIDEAIEKYPDYQQVAHTHAFMSAEMAATIKSSDIATDIAYHLGTNLDEAERIFKLPPVQQIKELGRLEMTLETKPPEVRTSAAPTPIKPVQKGKTTSTAYDTTDPRSVKQLSPTEWIAKDRARRGFK